MSQPAENTKVVATPYNLERFMASIWFIYVSPSLVQDFSAWFQ
jgi:hypothetical protein